MKTPLCFCNGVIRSGSTWSFNVCRELFRELATQLKQPFGSAYLDPEFAEKFVARHWASAPGPSIIKAHLLGPLAFDAIFQGHARAVCTYRDPRDCVASDVVFMGRGLDYSIGRVTKSLEILRNYQLTSNILLVKYEEMMPDRIGQIRRIAYHLGVPVTEATVQNIDAKTNVESSRKVCLSLKDRPAGQVLNIASHKVDPDTHLHENHIGTAKIGRWREELSGPQARWLTEYFSPFLLQFGYETQESLKRFLSAGTEESRPETAGAIPPVSTAGLGRFAVGSGLSQALSA